MATYFVEALVLRIPAAWREMVPSIPLTVLKVTAVDVVLDDLFLGDPLT